nr:J protein JJJ2-like isoform X1 [Ipomoea batatas]GMC94456.1 J protein JJJ2-like isoform X1 [Ipomoea batatas]GME19682.1 J protein JJJ2-like isoform X1 [Ipomoea batatas]
MECCNKTDALRAKEMAEKEFVEAQELALKAQTLFAGLDDGLSKLLEVINIHARSQRN